MTWHPVPGPFDNLEVADDLRVRVVERTVPTKKGDQQWPARVLSQTTNNKGYLVVNAHRNGRIGTASVHTLVALAFHGEPPGPIGRGVDDWQVDHLDGNKTNNAPSNLAWKQRRRHDADTLARGQYVTGEEHGNASLSDKQVDEIRLRAANGESQRSIASDVGCSQGHVSRIVNFINRSS